MSTLLTSLPVLVCVVRTDGRTQANMAKGGGTESMKNYRDADLVYLKIDNIHGVPSGLSAIDLAFVDCSWTV